jgi:hypothetical protein
MIQHEQTDSGGSVTVKSPSGGAWVSYTVSNRENALALQCSVSRGSRAELSNAVVESLVEKHTPVVLWVEAPHTETRYRPKFGGLFKCWSNSDEAVFAEAFAARKMFSRICTLSYAMRNTDIIREDSGELKFYDYHSVLKEIRSKTKPFEFLSIKEECDYSIKRASVDVVESVVSAAQGSLQTLTEKNSRRFGDALTRLEQMQSREHGFDTRYSYIQEATVSVLLPAVVTLGNAHPFTKSVFDVFSSAASKYTEACHEFLADFDEIIRECEQDD